MLGTLYADDFYVVVDVHSPKDRIVNILATLEQPLVITDAESEELAKELGCDYFLYENAVKT